MRLAIALLTLSLLAVACTTEPISQAVAEESIKVGWIGPLTGDAASLGSENLRGVLLAIQNINELGGIDGKNIQLVVQDDKLEEKKTLAAYQALVSSQGISYILTPTYGGVLALADRVDEDDVIIVSSIDSSEELAGIGQNVFAVGLYDESLGYAVAEYLNGLAVREVGIVRSLNDPFMILITEAFKNEYRGNAEIADYDFSTTDFRTTLAKFSSYEHIILFGWEETGNIIRQARQLGIDAQFIGIDTFASADFRENTGGRYDGLVFSFWQGSDENPLFNNMLASYEDRFSEQPENVAFVAIGYDAMSALADALQGCWEAVTCVRENMKTADFNGVTGRVVMDNDHVTRSISETMHMYEGDTIVPLA